VKNQNCDNCIHQTVCYFYRQKAIKWIKYCNKKGSKIQGEFESGLYTSKSDILMEFFEIREKELK
jgi:hypothetical protein